MSSPQETTAKPKPKPIEVVVTFPIGHGGPFKHEEDPSASVGSVLTAAMTHFNVTEQPGSSYYLTHDGTRTDGAATVGQVAGAAQAVKFTLVKELIQGQPSAGSN
jgi:hypothetical protein